MTTLETLRACRAIIKHQMCTLGAYIVVEHGRGRSPTVRNQNEHEELGVLLHEIDAAIAREEQK